MMQKQIMVKYVNNYKCLETGEVGSPYGQFKLKSNEELNKLLEGEIVLNGNQTEKIMDNVKKIAVGSTGKESVNIVIDMHDFTVTDDTLPKLQKLLKQQVPKIINETLFSKAIK